MAFSFHLSSNRAKLLLGIFLGWLAAGIFLLNWDAPGYAKGAAARLIHKGKPFDTAAFQQVGLWYAGWGVWVLLAGLLLTHKWWWRWAERTVSSSRSQSRPVGHWQWLALLSALVIAAALRLPNATEAILWDEHDNLRRNFHGFTDLEAKEEAEWKPAELRDAFFENKRANNPFFYSVLAHLSLDAWRAATGTPRDRFNVVPMRVPALVFGLLSICTVWGLGKRLGGPWVAATAALLCAVHPLHARYGVEARGYCIVLWLAPLFISQCWEVVASGRWRHAFSTSFVAAGLLYAFPGGVYFIGMGAVGLSLLLLWREAGELNRATFVRLVVAGTLALAVMLFLMMPGIMQALVNLDQQFKPNGLSAPWLAQTWHWMAVGLNYPLDGQETPLREHTLSWGAWLGNYVTTAPVTCLVSLVLIPGLLWRGGRHLWQSGAAGQLVVWISVGAPALCLLHHGLITHYSIFEWYLIYALPVLVVVTGIGFVQWLGGLEGRPAGTLIGGWAAALAAVVWASYGPLREERLGQYAHWKEEADLPTAHSQFDRGPNTWVTYADGRVLLLGKTAQLPKTD